MASFKQPAIAPRYESLAVDDNVNAHDYGQNHHVTTKRPPEWVPIMLRWLPAVLLAAFCASLLIGLAVLDAVVTHRNGLPMSDNVATKAIRYVPTVLFILLGIVWKRLVADLKKVTPWVAFSKEWTSAPHSVLINYFDSLDFISIWPAIRKRHWPLILGLIGGLICGALVPLAAVLTHVEVSVHETGGVPLSTYPFDLNHTLIDSNNLLTLPLNYTGNKAYAQAASVLRGDSKMPSWTTQDRAFEAFNLTNTGLTSDAVANTTVSAQIATIGTSLHCDIIHNELNSVFSVSNGVLDFFLGHREIVGSQKDLSEAKCDSNLAQEVIWCLGPNGTQGAASEFNKTNVNATPWGWLNMTNCSSSGDDNRFTFTLLQPYGKQTSPTSWSGKDMFRTLSLLCVPSFEYTEAIAETPMGTGDIQNYQLLGRPSVADFGLPVAGVVNYLNNPLNPDIQSSGALFDDNLDRINPEATDAVVQRFIPQCDSDAFTKSFLNLNLRPVGSYFDNNSLLVEDLTTVVSATMTQLISDLARSNTTASSSGQLAETQSRIVLTRWAVYSLQALLGVLGMSVVLVATILRPKTKLVEDPGLSANIALILSRSQEADLAMATNKSSTSLTWVGESEWRLVSTSDGASKVELRQRDHLQKFKEPLSPSSYVPIGLRTGVFLSLILAVAALVAALASLEPHGSTRGFDVNSQFAAAAWSFVPTTLLVLLGYAISGTTAALQQIAHYMLLRKNSLRGSKTMLFNSRDHSDILLPFYSWARLGSFSVLLGAAITLIYPAVKTAAAGLYVSQNGTATHPCTVVVDSNILHGYTDMLELENSRMTALQSLAADQADWLLIPDFGVTQPPGILSNLVFANLTSVAGMQFDEVEPKSNLTLRMPAVSVDVQCNAFDNDDFTTVAHQYDNANFPAVTDSKNDFTLLTGCLEDPCHDLLYQPPLVSQSSMSAGDYPYWLDANWTSHGFQVFIQNQTQFTDPVSANFTGAPHLNLSWPCSLSRDEDDYDLSCGGFFMDPTPDMFNQSIPTRQALVCTPNITRVEVDVTVSRATIPGLNGTSKLLPWAIAEYDVASISIVEVLNLTMDEYATLGLCRGGSGGDSVCYYTGTSLRPTRSDSDTNNPSTNNIFELMASFAEKHYGDLESLLDIEKFEAATKGAYITYMTTLLNQFRGNTALNKTSLDTLALPATLHSVQPRVQQSKDITIALEVLLGFILLCLIIVFFSSRTNTGLRNPPGSIAAQFMLLAGSEVVQRLREEGVRSAKESMIWNEVFGLGWWHGTEKDHVRWGIDVGTLDPDLQEEQEQVLRGERGRVGTRDARKKGSYLRLLQAVKTKT